MSAPISYTDSDGVYVCRLAPHASYAALPRSHHPDLEPWAVTTASPDGPWLGGQHLPEDVRRTAEALALLPPAQDVHPVALAVGPWCWAGPLRAAQAAGRGLRAGELGRQPGADVREECDACQAAQRRLRRRVGWG